METVFIFNIGAACPASGVAVCAGAVLLIASGAQAQNLLVSDADTGQIYEYTPGGAQSTLASGLSGPAGLAFNCAGDLLVAGGNSIYKFAMGGAQSTLATGLSYPIGLAFQPVPEPSALGLLAVGTIALLARRR